MADEGLPRLGADTLQTRAAQSEQIFEVRQRARDQVADQFDTVNDPRDVPIRRDGDRFVPGPTFLEQALPREAAFDLNPKFPNQDLGPGDVERTNQGFEATEPVRRRSAAFELEDRTGLDDIDPFGDLAPRDGGGFGLNEQGQRRVAADDLDPQFPDVDIGPGDLTPDGDAFGLNQQTQRRVAAERLEDQTPLGDVQPGDVRKADDGYQLRDSVIEDNIGLFR